MQAKSHHKILHYVLPLLVATIASCAQISNPSGGAKDIEAPFVYDTASYPLNFSTNFDSKTIELPFNEFIRLNDPSNQIVVSPPLEETPTYRIKGKKLIIDLGTNELLPNTTYTFNFGEAISDITENNKSKNLRYVVSTGTFIDSMICFGNVRNAFDLSPAKDVLVMLYADTADSIPLQQKPLYFSKTDESGVYSISYIKAGNYKVFALMDGNTNYLYDLPTEGVAFMDELHTPSPADSTLEALDFTLFFEDNAQQYIKTQAFTEPGNLLFVLNKPDETSQVNVLNPGLTNPWATSKRGLNGDSLSFWLPLDRPVDTLLLEVRVDTGAIDTVEIPIKRPEPDKGKKKKKPLTLQAQQNMRTNFDLFKHIQLNFNYPIDSVNQQFITLLRDSIETPFEVVRQDSEQRVVGFKVDWEPESNYKFVALPGAFKDIYGLQNDTLTRAFTTQKEHFYGIFNLDLSLPQTGHDFVLQFYDDKGVMLNEQIVKSTGKVQYINLHPGKYSLKLIYDENNNGKWDTGKYLEHTQPEKVIFFSDQIEIRSNWDLDLKWVVKPTP